MNQPEGHQARESLHPDTPGMPHRPVSWGLFDQNAPRYEAWYDTPTGRRVHRAECGVLARFLDLLRGPTYVMEVGCGTGHFARWLRDRGIWVAGLDRAPSMLVEGRQYAPAFPAILGDAHRLPLRDGGVHVTLLVTALEFLEEPTRALAEAVRVASQGVILLVLNRWSQGGISRRIGKQARGPLLRRARDYSLPEVVRLARAAAGARLQSLHWTSTLFPRPLSCVQAPVPVGDILGLALALETEGPPTERKNPAERG